MLVVMLVVLFLVIRHDGVSAKALTQRPYRPRLQYRVGSSVEPPIVKVITEGVVHTADFTACPLLNYACAVSTVCQPDLAAGRDIQLGRRFEVGMGQTPASAYLAATGLLNLSRQALQAYRRDTAALPSTFFAGPPRGKSDHCHRRQHKAGRLGRERKGIARIDGVHPVRIVIARRGSPVVRVGSVGIKSAAWRH